MNIVVGMIINSEIIIGFSISAIIIKVVIAIDKNMNAVIVATMHIDMYCTELYSLFDCFKFIV